MHRGGAKCRGGSEKQIREREEWRDGGKGDCERQQRATSTEEKEPIGGALAANGRNLWATSSSRNNRQKATAGTGRNIGKREPRMTCSSSPQRLLSALSPLTLFTQQSGSGLDADAGVPAGRCTTEIYPDRPCSSSDYPDSPAERGWMLYTSTSVSTVSHLGFQAIRASKPLPIFPPLSLPLPLLVRVRVGAARPQHTPIHPGYLPI